MSPDKYFEKVIGGAINKLGIDEGALTRVVVVGFISHRS